MRGHNVPAAVKFSSAVDAPRAFVVCIVATVLITVGFFYLAPYPPQNPLWWDFLMAVGMLGLGLLLAAPLVTPRVWVEMSGDMRDGRYVFDFHRAVSYLAIGLCLIHAVGLLVLDATVVEYLKITAPWQMLAANLALILLVAILLTSVWRVRFGIRYRGWRVSHAVLSTIVLLLVAWHVVGAGYFVNSLPKAFILGALTVAPIAAAGIYKSWHRRRGTVDTTLSQVVSVPRSGAAVWRTLMLLCVLWLALFARHLVPDAGSRAELKATECQTTAC